MAYPDRGSMLKFFVPNLAISGSATKPFCAINVAAANATHGEYVCVVPCTVRQIGLFVVLNTVSTSLAPVVHFTKYTIPAAGGTATVIDTVSPLDASTLGQVYYVKDLSTNFKVGDSMQIKHVVGTGGSVAGEVVPFWVCEADPEIVGNNSNMVLSL